MFAREYTRCRLSICAQVWDVRYGVLLALKQVRPGGDDADGSTPPIDSVPSNTDDDRTTGSSSLETPGGNGGGARLRQRSNSSASAAASSSVVGSMLSATQTVSSLVRDSAKHV